MIKDFSQIAILTSQNPEAFINFRFEAGDPSIYLIPQRNETFGVNKLLVNGLDISSDPSNGIYDISIGYAIYISNTGDPSIASFHLYTKSLENFDFNLRFFGWYNPTDISTDPSDFTIDISILNRPYIIKSNEINIYETSNIQIDGETSYLLLRTNPKFTGNIKLNIDPSNNMYLDTFKISDILNNKKYRKQKISGNSIFSGDIRRTFSDMPLGELYKLDSEDTLNISVPKTDLYKQYNLNYSYGARLFEDELYDDDYAILAPLWINSKLPDYFAIFRIDGVYNPETYPGEDEILSLENLANKYLTEGELIKSWSIKEATPIGTYLRNHLNELLEVRSPLFLSLSDPINQNDPDPNTWYGISVDKGIITGRSETTYFFDQKNTFTDTNAFVSEGFERLNLLCPNLINFEYIFSDHDVSLYTMHRYFGLYLTENELFNISYYASDPDASIQILSLDGKESSIFFNSNIFDSSGNLSATYQNRILTLDDILSIKRISNVEEINGLNKEYVNEWLNKPGDNIFSIDVEEKFTNKFITIELKNLLLQGEHLRIIDKTQNKIWEIYGSQTDLLNAGECWPYATNSEQIDGYPILYRTLFSVKGNLTNQIEAIKKAFDLFQDYLDIPFETTIIKRDKAQLSFKINDWANLNDIWFQRITSQTLNIPSDPSSGFNTSGNYDDIIYYGVLTPNSSDFTYLSIDSSYGPIDFELFGSRMSMFINFFDANDYYLYSFDSSVGDKFEEYTMYLGTDNWYRLVESFDISTNISHSFNYIKDPHELNNNLLVMTSNKMYTIKGKWNAYNTYPLIISLMGINPVKDMDFTVYDSSLGFESEYWYKREDDISTYFYNIPTDSSIIIDCKNSFEIIQGNGTIIFDSSTYYFDASLVIPFNTFDSSAKIIATNNVIVTYNQIDGSKAYSSYKTGYSEENINNFYIDSSIKDKLKYGLTVPYVTKWVGLGTDCRNNSLRLILDSSIFDDASTKTNFIPFNGNFEGEISYPSFKYLDSGDKAWENYIYFDVNDVIEYNIDGSILYTTFKQLMFDEPTIDIFSKLIYSNHNINETRLRSSIVFYNDYKKSIDTIISGLNLSFKLEQNATNTLDIRDWNRFRISFISSPSRNKNSNKPLEVIINENTKTILIIWYQGSDMLNYNKRYSTYFGGKSLLDASTSNIINLQGFKNNDNFWSFIKTPFVVNTAALSSNIINIYDIETSYDSSICSPYAQFNSNLIDSIYSIFNAYSGNTCINQVFEYFNKQYNTFKQYVNYTYLKDTASFGDGVINYGYNYYNNINIYKENTCDLNILKQNILENNVSYYIFKGNILYTDNNFTVSPIIISINDPRSYKNLYTYNGWYRPKFNNILEFKYNEDEDIINTTLKDFTFSNTNFKSYNYISQLWYNKVVEQVTTLDVSTKDAISYKEDFNVFLSQWDADYYIVDTSMGNTFVDGYNSVFEMPSYFGSKLIKLPEQLILENWDSTTTSSTDGRSWNTLEFNLTRKLLNMFKTTTEFTENWGELTTSDNVINNYIQNTIINYYNISKTKINVEIWTKLYDGRRIAFELDDTFTQDNNKNIDGTLNYVNSEYIYSIKTNKLPNLTYYIKFNLFEK